MTFKNVLIWGSTPLAAWLAGRLPAATWLADEAHRAAITTHGGLVINDAPPKPVRLITEWEEKPEVILLASPGWFTAQALLSLRSLIPLDETPPPIISLQLGVGHIPRIEAIFGAGQGMVGVVTKSVRYGTDKDGQPDRGHILADQGGGVALQNDHPHHAQVGELLREGGLQVIFGTGDSIAWSSVFWGIQANALSSILNRDPADIYHDSRWFAYEHEQLLEAFGLIRYMGIRLIALPGVNVPLMARQVGWIPRNYLGFWLARHPRPPSLKTDLQLGTGRSDAAYLNGAIAYHAHQLGLHTPVNYALALTLTDIAEGRAVWSAFQNNPKLLDATIRLAKG